MTAMLLPTGMTAASFTIMWMRIKLEKHSLVFCSSGAFAGTIFGKTHKLGRREKVSMII